MQVTTESVNHQPQITALAEYDESAKIMEKVIRFFANSPQSIAHEKELEDQIFDIVQEFLNAQAPNTEVDFNTLMNGFLGSAIPLEPINLNHYIDYLSENVVTHATRTASPRFIGHMTSSLPYFVRPLAKLLAAMNQNVVKTETAKTLTPYERQAIAMIHRLIYGFSDHFYNQHIQSRTSTLGMIVSGGTIANITALWCALNTAFGPKDEFGGIEYEGLPAALVHYGYQDAVIIGSSLMHFSFDKAADLLGIGLRNLIKIPVDHQNRMDLDQLHQAVATCIERNQRIIAFVGVAGTTDSGGVDPLPEIAALARSVNAHFHVDAAWGGPLLFSDKYRHILTGIEKADSVTFDGHKQLYLPMGIGMLMLLDPNLATMIEKKAPYAVRAGSFDLGRRALEGSRPATSLYLHAALHIIGQAGFAFLIDEGMRKTRYMTELIHSRPEFELLAEPQINILIYRYIPARWREKIQHRQLTAADNEAINAFNKALQKKQRELGHTFVSRTVTRATRYGPEMPIIALRVVLANPLTTEVEIGLVLDDQINLAAELN